MCSAEGGICKSEYYCSSGCCCYIPGEATTTTSSSTTSTTSSTTTIPCNPDECEEYCLNLNRPGGYCSNNKCYCYPTGTKPIPAGIFENLWTFIKSLLGIQ
jgi:hypothetical protein